MSILTPFFNLIKPAKSDGVKVSDFNANMDKIDTEMHKPPLTFNGIEPDPESRNLHVTTVPLADNLTSDEMQINTGTYIIRSSGGEAPIENGNAMLSEIQGNMVKTGYIPESLDIRVTVGDDRFSITYDRETFVEAMGSSGTIVFEYTNAWNVNPSLYGITVNGTPENGDTITAIYVQENRGTIVAANPTAFVSTGWNLYNHSAGYARVVKYSEEYGFMIAGNYSTIKFSETLNGEKVTISPVNGYFTLPAGANEGYVFLTGGNATNTEIWMTWSDWTEQPNDGTFAPYSQTSIDLTGIMVYFPYGLMRIGNVFDEIDLNTLRAYNRIERLEYTEENLESVIESGVPYDTDNEYIYAVMENPVNYSISIDGGYTANDHGIEMFTGTSVAITASSFYGNDLKNKLRTDVLTISQQTLTTNQKNQVLNNIGALSKDAIANNLTTTASGKVLDARQGKILNDKISKRSLDYFNVAGNGGSTSITLESNSRYLVIVNSTANTARDLMIVSCSTNGNIGATRIVNSSNLDVDTGTANILKITCNAANGAQVYVEKLQQ